MEDDILSENKPNVAETAAVPVLPDMSVKVFPTQEPGKLLAKASVTLGGCFTVNQIRVYDTEKGPFVAMPSTRGGDGNFHDICYPTTKEMREALSSAVIEKYQQTVELISSRGRSAVKKPSVLDKIQEPAKTSAERTAPVPGKERKADKGAR